MQFQIDPNITLNSISELKATKLQATKLQTLMLVSNRCYTLLVLKNTVNPRQKLNNLYLILKWLLLLLKRVRQKKYTSKAKVHIKICEQFLKTNVRHT